MSTEETRNDALQRLTPLVGVWAIEVPDFPPLPPELAEQARMTVEWTLGGAYLLQRSSVPVPKAPDGHCLIAAHDDADGYTQHYFDSRGVTRVYAMTFDGRRWTLERHAPDFTPLSFHQRFTGTLVDDDRIDGRWETSPDGENWARDFDLTYRRVG
ncbi:MAG: hypothetical protein WC558_00245 [Patulibacter sp.]